MIKGAIPVYFDDIEIYLDNEPDIKTHPSWIQGYALTKADLADALREAFEAARTFDPESKDFEQLYKSADDYLKEKGLA